VRAEDTSAGTAVASARRVNGGEIKNEELTRIERIERIERIAPCGEGGGVDADPRAMLFVVSADSLSRQERRSARFA
jgi:hypothetical protein